MPDLTVESRQVGDVMVISPHGFINAHTVREFEQALSQALEDGNEKILINGSGLAYIASAGLGVIMGLIEDVRAKGGDIVWRSSTTRCGTSSRFWDSTTSARF